MVRTVKKPEERRKEIILAAQKIFLEQEYEKTSMNEIVSKVGIAKGTIYHYFKTKEELLEAVVDNLSEEYVYTVKNSLGKEGSVLECFQKLIKVSNIANKWKEKLTMLHQAGNIGLHVRLLAASIKKLAPLYAVVIQRGCNEGIFKTCYPLETAEILLAGMQFIIDSGIYPWTQEELSRRMIAMSSLIESQLGAEKGSLSLLG